MWLNQSQKNNLHVNISPLSVETIIYGRLLQINLLNYLVDESSF